MVTSDTACTHVQTQAECDQAAVFLNLEDTESDQSQTGTNIPPYCSYHFGSTLLFHDKTGKEEFQKCNIDLHRSGSDRRERTVRSVLKGQSVLFYH